MQMKAGLLASMVVMSLGVSAHGANYYVDATAPLRLGSGQGYAKHCGQVVQRYRHRYRRPNDLKVFSTIKEQHE